jgi:hypothetical protein
VALDIFCKATNEAEQASIDHNGCIRQGWDAVKSAGWAQRLRPHYGECDPWELAHLCAVISRALGKIWPWFASCRFSPLVRSASFRIEHLLIS